MTTRYSTALVAIAIALGASPTANAIIDAYVKVDGIKGDAKIAGHKGWIYLDSMSWDPPAYRGRPSYNETVAPHSGGGGLTIVLAKSSSATAAFKEYCANGKHIAALQLAEPVHLISGDANHPLETLRAEAPFRHYQLKDVTVVSCPDPGEAPGQGFEIKFADIERTDKPSKR